MLGKVTIKNKFNCGAERLGWPTSPSELVEERTRLEMRRSSERVQGKSLKEADKSVANFSPGAKKVREGK